VRMHARTLLDANLINRRWNATTARTVLAAWRASGTSLSAFARENGVGVWRLGWWRKQLEAGQSSRPARQGAPIAPLTFVPATVTSSSSTRARIAVRLPSGVEVEAADANALPVQWLAELARALGREP
jgi:transposase-like protein